MATNVTDFDEQRQAESEENDSDVEAREELKAYLRAEVRQRHVAS